MGSSIELFWAAMARAKVELSKLESNGSEFFEKEKKTRSTMARKDAQEIKKIMQEIREIILEARNQM
jgi:hypothetical protein